MNTYHVYYGSRMKPVTRKGNTGADVIRSVAKQYGWAFRIEYETPTYTTGSYRKGSEIIPVTAERKSRFVPVIY